MTDMKIHVNQLGYRPGDQKIAVIASDEPLNGSLALVNESDSTKVELGIQAFGSDSYSGETLYWADFSHVKTKAVILSNTTIVADRIRFRFPATFTVKHSKI